METPKICNSGCETRTRDKIWFAICFCWAHELRMVFTLFNCWGKKNQKKNLSWTSKLYGIKMSVFIKSVIGTHLPLFVPGFIVCRCFHTTKAGLSSWDRDHRACKAKIFALWLFKEKFDWLLQIIISWSINLEFSSLKFSKWEQDNSGKFVKDLWKVWHFIYSKHGRVCSCEVKCE